MTELLDAEQVALMLAVSTRTIWRMVREEKIPHPLRLSRKLVRWDGEVLRRSLGVLDVSPLPAPIVPPTPPQVEVREVRRLITSKQIARLLQIHVTSARRLAVRLRLEKRTVGQGYAVTDAQMETLLSMRVLPTMRAAAGV